MCDAMQSPRLAIILAAIEHANEVDHRHDELRDGRRPVVPRLAMQEHSPTASKDNVNDRHDGGAVV